MKRQPQSHEKKKKKEEEEVRVGLPLTCCLLLLTRDEVGPLGLVSEAAYFFDGGRFPVPI